MRECLLGPARPPRGYTSWTHAVPAGTLAAGSWSLEGRRIALAHVEEPAVLYEGVEGVEGQERDAQRPALDVMATDRDTLSRCQRDDCPIYATPFEGHALSS